MPHWEPILAVDDTSAAQSHRGVQALARIWSDESAKRKDSPGTKRFLDRLHREWAIETGILERQYELDEGTTLVLLERGFEAALIPHNPPGQSPEWVSLVLKDNREALDVLLDVVGGTRELSTNFVKELHILLTRHQEYADAVDPTGVRLRIPLAKGIWKLQPNNPRRPDGTVHEYCPPEHVGSEMDRLLSLHAQNISNGVPVEVQAAWLHHRFTQIHPFQDGNGRVARALATLVFLKDGWVPLVVRRGDREEYLSALETADALDLAPLVRLFAKIEEGEFTRAILASGPPAETLMSAAAEFLRDPTGASEKDKVLAKQLVAVVHHHTGARVSQLVAHSQSVLSPSAAVYSQGEISGRWLDTLNKALGQDLAPLPQMATGWIQLVLPAPAQAEYLISIHTPGPLFRGILVAVVVHRFLTRADAPFKQLGDPFVFGVSEQGDDVRLRMNDWIEESLASALANWLRELQSRSSNTTT